MCIILCDFVKTLFFIFNLSSLITNKKTQPYYLILERWCQLNTPVIQFLPAFGNIFLKIIGNNTGNAIYTNFQPTSGLQDYRHPLPPVEFTEPGVIQINPGSQDQTFRKVEGIKPG